MGYSKKVFEQTGEGVPSTGNQMPQNGIQNVQNLEAIINEGLRVALQEETPDQSLKVLLAYLGKALHGVLPDAMSTPTNG